MRPHLSLIERHKLHMGRAGSGNALASQCQLLLGNIDAKHLPARPNSLGHAQG
jgi:hypothetical protein